MCFICRSLELCALSVDSWFSDGVAYPKLPWLSSDLLPKLVRWATECRSSEFRSTLSLLPVEKYSLMYQQLKDKYKAMVKVRRLDDVRLVYSFVYVLFSCVDIFIYISHTVSRFGLRLQILKSLCMRMLLLLRISWLVQTFQ